jgi:cytochrome c2
MRAADNNSGVANRLGRRVWFWRALVALGVTAVLVATFVGGAYSGRWAVKNQVSARLRLMLENQFKSLPKTDADAGAEWQSKATHLVRLESTVIHLPAGEGWGGGLQPLPDGRLFYATRAGEFGLLGTDRIARMMPFRVDMNIAALERHPASKLKNFNAMWFRVTDVDMVPIGNGRFDLLVGHHHFDEAKACVQTRLSHAELEEKGGEWSMVRPFEVLLTTTPCITFYHPSYEFAFEGHFSGGRIARLPDGQALFTTGDHGWMGVRGYPSVSAEDGSTLGKILLVNVPKRTVETFVKGVRNPQGLHIDSKGRIWETEHGPRGGDELNLITRGQDYGWPYATYGTDYGPRPWAHSAVQGQHDKGVRPQYSWVPSIGVSNLLELRGAEFPLWKGDLLVLSLTGQSVHRLRLDGDRVAYDEPIRFEGQRLRDIAEMPDGRIALLSDHGTIILLRNADQPGVAPYLDASRSQKLSTMMSEAERAFAVAGRFATPASAATAVASANGGDDAGQKVFQANCASCHSLQAGAVAVGPSLHRVVGRKVGSTDFAYSEGLAGRGDAWTADRIVSFAADPAAMYPGSVMAPVPLSAAQGKDLARFLVSASH